MLTGSVDTDVCVYMQAGLSHIILKDTALVVEAGFQLPACDHGVPAVKPRTFTFHLVGVSISS